jgi:hypothetical protein
VWDRHARLLQKWWRGRLGRAAFLKLIRSSSRAVLTIQRRWRHYCKWYLHPRKQRAAMKESTALLSRFCKGYLARKRGMKAMMHHKAQLLYDEWHRIDVIVKGHFQRRLRKVWMKYITKKKEKARKKKEAAAKKKKGFKSYTKKTTVKADPSPAKPVATQKPQASTSPTKPLSKEPSNAQVKEVTTDPTDPLAATTIDISTKK